MTDGPVSRNPSDWDRTLIDEQLRDHVKRTRQGDPLGKRALYSVSSPRPGPLGQLVLECSSCKRESPVRWLDLPRLAFPFTITLPRKYHTMLKCPACGRRTWVRAHWRV